MNEKAKKFEQFLLDEEITCFEKREVGDEEHTVVYRSYIQTTRGDMPIFVLLDDTIYNVVRVLLGGAVVTGENRQRILEFANRINNSYKNFKIYVEDEDDSVYLDCVNQSTIDYFDGRLLYVLMTQIVEFIPTVIDEMCGIFGIERLKSFDELHAHSHEVTQES